MPARARSASSGTTGACSSPETSSFPSANANASDVPGNAGGVTCAGTKPTGVCIIGEGKPGFSDPRPRKARMVGDAALARHRAICREAKVHAMTKA